MTDSFIIYDHPLVVCCVPTGTGIKMMDAMYFQKKKLETVFYFFDSNGDGRISREEFHKGDPFLHFCDLSPHCTFICTYIFIYLHHLLIIVLLCRLCNAPYVTHRAVLIFTQPRNSLVYFTLRKGCDMLNAHLPPDSEQRLTGLYVCPHVPFLFVSHCITHTPHLSSMRHVQYILTPFYLFPCLCLLSISLFIDYRIKIGT